MIQLSKYHPILKIKSNLTYSNNEDLVLSFSVRLNEIHTLSEKGYDEKHDGFVGALKTLTQGFLFYKQDIVIDSKLDTSDWSQDSFIQHHNAKHFNGREYKYHFCLIHIIFNRKGSMLHNNNIRNPLNLIKNTNISTYSEDLIELEGRAKQLVSFLEKGNSYKIKPLDKEELEDFTNRYFNGLVENEYSDTISKKSETKVGDKELMALCITSNKQFENNEILNLTPDQTFSTQFITSMKPLAQDFIFEGKCDRIYNQLISIEDHIGLRKGVRKLKGNFETAGEVANDLEGSGKALKEMDEELSSDASIRLIRAHFSLLLFANNKEELNNAKQDIKNAFTTLGISPYIPKGNSLRNIFYNGFYSLVSNLDEDSTFTCSLDTAVKLFNYETPTISDKEGVLINDRLTQVPVKRDNWDAEKVRIKARNFFIIAPTGEGKSNLAQQILTGTHYADPETVIFICDLGESFRKWSWLFGEKAIFVRYKHGESLGINPFEWYGSETPTPEFLSDIIGFLEIPYKSGQKLNKEERRSLEKILQFYYEQDFEEHSFPHFYEFMNRGLNNDLLGLLEIPDEDHYFNSKQFKHNCSRYVGDGLMSFLFSDKKTKNYDVQGKKIIVFEFDEAKEDADLLAILLQLKDNIIQRLIWSNKNIRGVVFYDEVKKFFTLPMVFESVCYSAQTMRKYEASIGMAMQSPTNIPFTPDRKDLAIELIKNTQIFWCLPDADGYDEHKERLKMSDDTISLLKSIRSNFKADKPYSEFLLSMKGGHDWVLRSELPYPVWLIYQTDGTEHERLVELYEQYPSVEETIKQYMIKYK